MRGSKNEEPLESILSEIKTESTKRDLLNDLVSVCYADGEYSEDEERCIQYISEILHIDQHSLGDTSFEYGIDKYEKTENKFFIILHITITCKISPN